IGLGHEGSVGVEIDRLGARAVGKLLRVAEQFGHALRARRAKEVRARELLLEVAVDLVSDLSGRPRAALLQAAGVVLLQARVRSRDDLDALVLDDLEDDVVHAVARSAPHLSLYLDVEEAALDVEIGELADEIARRAIGFLLEAERGGERVGVVALV